PLHVALPILLALAFLVYCMALWTYTLLPFPDAMPAWCAEHGANAMQTRPLQVISDIRREQATSTGTLLHNPAVQQAGFNVALFVPRGMFVRHLFRRGWLLTGGVRVAVRGGRAGRARRACCERDADAAAAVHRRRPAAAGHVDRDAAAQAGGSASGVQRGVVRAAGHVLTAPVPAWVAADRGGRVRGVAVHRVHAADRCLVPVRVPVSPVRRR